MWYLSMSCQCTSILIFFPGDFRQKLRAWTPTRLPSLPRKPLDRTPDESCSCMQRPVLAFPDRAVSLFVLRASDTSEH